MPKIWKLKDSKLNKLILIQNNSIYKGNPAENDFNRITTETKDFSFVKNLFNIPYSYIKRVEKQKGGNHIKIFFGNDSEEELFIDDELIKNDIFNQIKADNPKLSHNSELPSIVKYAKAPLFALLFITGIFIWSLYLAIEIENGAEYILIGGGRGITGIVLAIANLGVKKIVIGYITLLTIGILALIRKLNSRSQVESLQR